MARPAGDATNAEAILYIKSLSAAELKYYSRFGRYAGFGEIRSKLEELIGPGAPSIERAAEDYYSIDLNLATAGYIITAKPFDRRRDSYCPDQGASIRYAPTGGVATAVSPVLR